MRRTCQRCDLLYPECECPTFDGEEGMECTSCGALQGQHLVDFTDHPQGEDRLICPPPVVEPERRRCPECGEVFIGFWADGQATCYFDGTELDELDMPAV